MLTALTERISYLRGLASGLDVSEKSAEGKLLMEIVGILDEMHAEFRELHTRIDETEDYVQAIDEDLEDVELFLFENEEDLYETVTDCEDSHHHFAAEPSHQEADTVAVNPT
ncbi:CD1247 N-terminal domain-containing protein [Brevibacillus sp. GCM10020057]|uniref:CD1247 N-terminal domain-containing protein n=1 Tax=Brevibacillus sp. GCM10020057 TaxID=3317327 RepID=UPI00363137CD